MVDLIKYDAARRAVAEAKTVDEVLNAKDNAEMMQAYGRIAKDRTIEENGLDIRMRAERRLGELIEKQKETVGLAPAGRPPKNRVSEKPNLRPPTLKAAGVGKNLAHKARKLAAMEPDEFEQEVTVRKRMVKTATNRETPMPRIRADYPDIDALVRGVTFWFREMNKGIQRNQRLKYLTTPDPDSPDKVRDAVLEELLKAMRDTVDIVNRAAKKLKEVGSRVDLPAIVSEETTGRKGRTPKPAKSGSHSESPEPLNTPGR